MTLLRFGTYNLLGGLVVATGTAREDDLRSAIAAVDADVLALQEVDRGQPRSDKTDQAAVAADELGARWWRFAPALAGDPSGQWDAVDPLADPSGPAYGIALVSRLPLREWTALTFPASSVRIPLRVPGRRGLIPVADHPRVAIAAVADGPGGPITVAAAHLSFVPGWNIRQLRAIVRWLSELPAPRFLLGDLNLPGTVPAGVTRWGQLARVPTYPSWRPRVQWDHVLASGVEHSSARTVTAHRLPVSDHAALTVDVEL